jgi:hypothetical protein
MNSNIKVERCLLVSALVAFFVTLFSGCIVETRRPAYYHPPPPQPAVQAEVIVH